MITKPAEMNETARCVFARKPKFQRTTRNLKKATLEATLGIEIKMVRQLLPLRATQTSVSRRNLSILSTVSTHIHRVLCNRSAMEVPQGCV
jgi:hypothetical protein